MNREMGFPTSAQAKRESQREKIPSFKLHFLLTEEKREGERESSFSICQLCLIPKQIKTEESP